MDHGRTIAEFEPFADREEPPYELLSEMRRSCPIVKVPSGFWYLSRYKDVDAVLRDWRTFVSEGGMRLPGVKVPEEEKLINEKDGPGHLRLRRLLQGALTPAKIKATEPFIQDLADTLIRDARARGRADLAEEFCEPIPGTVLNYLIGIPLEHQPQFTQWVDEVVSGPYPATNRGHNGEEGLARGYPKFSAYVEGLIEERRRMADPPDDLISAMVASEADGQQMSDTEIRTAVMHLITAGNKTTANAMANLLYRLVEDPKRYARVQADRTLIPAAIEESLRFDARTQFLTRTCARDVEVAGVHIRAGERVVVGIASANRDDDAYGDAATFSLDRSDPPGHFTFGLGAHFCLGAALARLEIETAINVLMDVVPSVHLAPGFTLERLPSFWAYGLRHLDVVFD